MTYLIDKTQLTLVLLGAAFMVFHDFCIAFGIRSRKRKDTEARLHTCVLFLLALALETLK